MPFCPLTVVAATGSTSSSDPPPPTQYAEIIPPPNFVTQAMRPSAEAIAQQTSLRPFFTDRLTGASAPSSRYDEAAAAPASPPNASVTTSTSPAKSKPYGVTPADA